MLKSLQFVLRSILSLALGLVAAGPVLAQSQEPAIRPRVPQQQAKAVAQPLPPKVPFQLNSQQQQRMDQLLVAWERESDKVKLFKCKFTRWDYDKTFGPKQNDFLISERHGEIKFRAPDAGTFKEIEMKKYVPPKDDIGPNARGTYEVSKEDLDHWVCDGTAIYQFKPREKTLEITELPKEMRGKAITDGPLPFIFGAKAETLRQRYWIRETTPNEQEGRQVWLEAWPKFREQAANFQRVEVILGAQDLMPVAMQVYLPNGNDRTAYVFDERKVNDKFGDLMSGDFMPPMKPLSWKKVVNPANPPAAQAPPVAPLKQAARPKSGAVR